MLIRSTGHRPTHRAFVDRIFQPGFAAVLCITALCASCDSTKSVDGARGRCAVGGAINGCEATALTAIDACNKMVDCGAIPVDHEDPNGFDWGRCVDDLSSQQPDQQRFTLACIAAAPCDELKTDGSPNNPYGRIACFTFGDR
jgi:hypothetical protein